MTPPQGQRSPIANVLIYLGSAALSLSIAAILYQTLIMTAFAVQQPEERTTWILNIASQSLLGVAIGIILIVIGLCLPRPTPVRD